MRANRFFAEVAISILAACETSSAAPPPFLPHAPNGRQGAVVRCSTREWRPFRRAVERHCERSPSGACDWIVNVVRTCDVGGSKVSQSESTDLALHEEGPGRFWFSFRTGGSEGDYATFGWFTRGPRGAWQVEFGDLEELTL